MCSTWFPTVLGLMARRRAIALFGRPWVMRCRTSRSRTVRPGAAVTRTRFPAMPAVSTTASTTTSSSRPSRVGAEPARRFLGVHRPPVRPVLAHGLERIRRGDAWTGCPRSASRTEPSPRSAPSPVDGAKLGPDDMALVRRGVLLVVDEVPGIPDDDVGAVDVLAREVLVEAALGVRGCTADDVDPVVEFGPPVPKEPEVRDPEAVGGSVGGARRDAVAAARAGIEHAPAAGGGRVGGPWVPRGGGPPRGARGRA